MKTVPALQQFIEEIASVHAFDLSPTAAYLCLEVDGYRLVLENIGASRISIACQLLVFDEWTADPEIVIWTGYYPTRNVSEREGNQWVPIALNQIHDGWHACAEIDGNGMLTDFYQRRWQATLAGYIEQTVVPNLLRQGWLEKGVQSDEPPPTYTLEQLRERGYLVEGESFSVSEEPDDIPF